jgi:hypothetical protein
MSKAAMDILLAATTKHMKEDGIISSGAFKSAMESLSTPIEKKYIWQQEGKHPPLWQKATTTALAILSAGFPNANSSEADSDPARRVWAEMIHKIARGIIGARNDVSNPLPWIEKDEGFDMRAFSNLRDMLTESLGWGCISDSVRRTYAIDLFQTSIIHLPTPGEMDYEKLARRPLEDLYKIRRGQTKDPEPIPRTGIAYMCLSELISLVSAHDSSPDRVRLAKAAAPYLILRAALPLRAYIADHPLRGCMPAPESQRRELLYILEALRELKSQPLAIPDAPGVKSKYRKHLHRLYPLLIKATKVARHDMDVFNSLTALTEIVGDEFGFEDE